MPRAHLPERARAARSLPLLLLPAALAATSPALGDPLPAGAAPKDAATKGTTEVASGGKFELPARAADTAKDATSAEIAAGGLLATGNARSAAGTAAASGRLRRSDEQLTGTLAVNYARAAVPPSRRLEPTVENYQGRVRFDHFLGGGLAAFLSTTARRDRFQGLDLRLNVDPGAAYYFLDEKAHQAWVELGYDLQLDLRSAEAVATAEAAGEPVDDSKLRHNARLYLGYQNTLSEAVAFTAGLEVLQGISETDASRVNGDLALTSKIAGRFSLATTFALKYDAKPLPDVQSVDTMTAVNLVYQLL